MQTHFENIKNSILEELENAKDSISVASAYFTDDELGLKLAEKAAKGIPVDLIISNAEVNDPKEYLYSAMRQAGVNVYRTGAANFTEGSVMHHKFCVIDYETVITGSYNWTNQAARNNENIVVFKDKVQASLYLQVFYQLRDAGSVHAFGNGPDINLSVDRVLVRKGEKIKVSWKVTGADHQELSISGNVDNSGNTEIIIHDDELIVLTAYAQNRRSEKSVFVKLIRDPEISFYATENAIINTQATCLKWDVQHATSVTIEPELGIVPAKGSRDINPDKSITYTLTATGNDGVPHVKTAQITVFPTPVITNLIIPMPDNLRIETAITKISLPVPSLLNLSLLDRVEFHFARINAINTAYLPAKPSLRTVAESIPMPEEELKQDLRRIKSDLKSVTRRIPRY